MILLQLMISFMTIGVGAYGGGMVTIPLIQKEIVEFRGWLTFEEMARIIAIAQMTPGPIAVNAATYTGFRLAGFAGASVATFAVILPAIVLMSLLIFALEKLPVQNHLDRFKKAIQPAILSLIIFAVWSFGSRSVTSPWGLVLAVAAFAVMVRFDKKIHPFMIIIASGIVGYFVL